MVDSVDGSNITHACLHDCGITSRLGSRPRRFLLTGHQTGSVQVWDMMTALELFASRPSPPRPQPKGASSVCVCLCVCVCVCVGGGMCLCVRNDALALAAHSPPPRPCGVLSSLSCAQARCLGPRTWAVTSHCLLCWTHSTPALRSHTPTPTAAPPTHPTPSHIHTWHTAKPRRTLSVQCMRYPRPARLAGLPLRHRIARRLCPHWAQARCAEPVCVCVCVCVCMCVDLCVYIHSLVSLCSVPSTADL
jgi:hypothetical protein